LKLLLLNLRSVLWALLDGLVLLIYPYRVRGNSALIVRLDAIGDFVLWLDAARSLTASYHAQGYTVLLLGNNVWASWAREMGVADEVLGIDVRRYRKNLLYRWSWLIRIRKLGFSDAIQPTFSRLFLEGDSLVRASGATVRIGSEGNDSNVSSFFRKWGGRWYTRLIPAAPMQMMELKRNAEFMHGLGYTDFKAGCPHIPKPAHQLAPLLPLPYVVLAPTASWNGKMWPIDRLVKIGDLLMALGYQLVVVGGPADRKRASELTSAYSGAVIDLVGRTTLDELAEVLRSASIVVSNDTSAVHIGAAVDAPVVCILGGGHFGRFAPYDIDEPDEGRRLPVFIFETMPCFGCNWHCQFPRQKGKAVKCVSDIPISKVWNAVEQLLVKESRISRSEDVRL